MSLIKDGINCLFLSKIQSAKGELKSKDIKAFRNPEHFYINTMDGVILECLIEKKSAKKVEYFWNILSCGSSLIRLCVFLNLKMLTEVLSIDLLTRP